MIAIRSMSVYDADHVLRIYQTGLDTDQASFETVAPQRAAVRPVSAQPRPVRRLPREHRQPPSAWTGGLPGGGPQGTGWPTSRRCGVTCFSSSVAARSPVDLTIV
jgi:hypothetical protein